MLVVYYIVGKEHLTPAPHLFLGRQQVRTEVLECLVPASEIHDTGRLELGIAFSFRHTPPFSFLSPVSCGDGLSMVTKVGLIHLATPDTPSPRTEG